MQVISIPFQRSLSYYVIMAIRYEKIEKTKNSKSFFGYKTKENQ